MNSIRRQLTRRLLALTIALLVLGVGGLLGAACFAVIEQFDLALKAKALAISTVVVVTPEKVTVNFTDRFLHTFDDKVRRDFFQLWAVENGNEVARSESLKPGEVLPRTDVPRGKTRYSLLTLPTGRPGRSVAMMIRPRLPGVSKRVQGPEFYLVVASDREDLDETLLLLFGLAAGFAVLLIGATLWVVPRVLRSGLRPIDELGDRAAQIEAHTLSQRFAVDALPEELRPIARRLNDLLARLEASFGRERRFSADLAHELRTPLAELRTLTECALKWPETREANTDRETLAITVQMERLVEHLLAMTRGEEGRLTTVREPVALDALVREVWGSHVARAEARHLTVELALAPRSVTADPALLKAIVANLCDNAAEYTPAGGKIRLATWATGIECSNTVENFAAADVEQMFERFWRKEVSRTGNRHAGLGLSLARAFAQAMGWTLTAELRDGGWLVFRLEPA